mmetsp:Transcript_25949/g.77297  ORF Transcript_25949/g.77297 Transcript_25949/m.77297 type:complete len:211 (+) Transcript_25949:74-706(+)
MSLHPWTRLCECPRSVLTSLHPGGLELALLHELAATGDGARRVNDAGALRHGVARVDQLLDLGLRHEIAVRRLERAGVLLLHRGEDRVDQLLGLRLLGRLVAVGCEEELDLPALVAHRLDVTLLDRVVQGEDGLTVLLQGAGRLALEVRQGLQGAAERRGAGRGASEDLTPGDGRRNKGLRAGQAQRAASGSGESGQSRGGPAHHWGASE